VPEQKRFDELCEHVRSTLTNAGVKPGDLFKTLPKARKRVFAEKYGVPAQQKRNGGRRHHSGH